jgi:hydrophobe/amphiphile efflux-1 (HAE1) family protein
MSLPEIAIRRPVFAWMLMAALMIFGGISFSKMGVSQLPDVDFPVVTVSATLDGAAPEVMEMDVVEPIESAVLSVEGVQGVSSSARAGSASVTIDFDLSKNIDVAVQEVQTKIAQAQRSLPANLDPPVVSKSNPEDQPIIWLSVSSSEMSPPELMQFVRERLQDQFTTLPGVADVFLGGYVDPNVRVWVDPKKLNAIDLTVLDVVQAIKSEHSEQPSGRIEVPEKEYNIRALGEATSIQEMRRLAINRRGGGPNFGATSLDQVARVELSLADVRRISRAMGKPAIGIGIRKQRGVNAVDVAKAVYAKKEEIQKQLPPGAEIGVNFDSTRFIEESVHELNFTLLLSAILTALVCWAFLGSWSATLNVILAIPTSVVGTFIVLYFMGFTLNTFTLLGLSLAIGIVVDDAIMVLENIVRHREMGKSRLEASRQGATEITFAAMAATAAIIAIFLPIAFMKGLIGKYLYQFGVTLTVAVALSLLEALTLTPMRTSQFLSTGERTTRFGKAVEALFHRGSELYGRCIPWVLAHRWTTIAMSLVFFGLSLAVVPRLKKELVPAQDQGSLLIRMKAPDGSSLSYMDERMKMAEAIVQKRGDVLRYFGSVGGFGGGDVSSATLFVTLKPRSERKLSQVQVADELRESLKQVKGARAFIQDLSLAGFSSRRGFPVEFGIRGPEFDGLGKSVAILKKEMEASGLVSDIDTDFRANATEVHVIPDREAARLRGVSLSDLGQTMSALMGGAVAGRFSQGGNRIDIRVKIDQNLKVDLEQIRAIRVRNNRGELIPLSSVAKVELSPALQSINRQDRERSVSVYANLATGVSQQKAMDDIQARASKLLPPGYRLVTGGSAKTFTDSFNSLIFALILGLIVSYMVLASQFNSFIDPVTVLLALPFSLSGAFLALWMGGQSINIYSMIGIVLLMGIVKKNSILLVDFTNQMRSQGHDVRESIILACPVRLRPILMTSFATVAGALPAALAIGPGAESRIPMALAVMGGVLVSTVLTLFVVPAAYSLFARQKPAEQL